MPNWAGSSWYYLRYYDAHNDQAFADREKVGLLGRSRYVLGWHGTHNIAPALLTLLASVFIRPEIGTNTRTLHARRGQGIILAADGSKMSKSKGNIVNPTEIIANGYGADALRLAIAFLAPYDQTTPWSPESVAGTHRFLQRVWTLVQEFTEAGESKGGESPDIRRIVNKAIKKVGDDLDNLNFNTAIAALMTAVNELYHVKAGDGYASSDWQWALTELVKILSPFAPHICEELWQQLGQGETISGSEWPICDDQYLVSDSVTIIIQVNGKLRGEIQIELGLSENDVIERAKAKERVSAYLYGKNLKRTVYVAEKLVNFVTD